MGELAELLELLYTARTRFRTARGTLLYRHSNALLHAARLRQVELSRERGVHVSQYAVAMGEAAPDVHAERLRFWWQSPLRLREEVESDTPHQSRTTVVDGDVWWLYREDLGALSNVDLPREERVRHQTGGGDRFRPLLDPSGFSAALELGELSRAGGRFRVRARPRDDVDWLGVRFHLHLVAGADEHVLEVDCETGVVRRLASLLGGREIAVTEIVELALDEELPEETFTFVPPPGVEVLPPEPFRPRRYTLEEAAAEAPFPVFAIRELPPGGWRLDVHFQPARTRPAAPAHLFLHYHRSDGRGTLSLGQRPAGEGGFGWPGLGPSKLETVERDGVELTIARGDPGRGGQDAVVLERDGTALQLQSPELDVETLVGLALSLERVSGA